MNTELRIYPSPKWKRQVQIAVRPDTADEPVIVSTSSFDEYGTIDFDLQAEDVFLDVGAHIGSVGLCVAADYPDATVVMIEAVPENADLIATSIMANGWAGRVKIYEKAAAKEQGGTTVIPYGAGASQERYWHDNRFIGGLGGLEGTIQKEQPNITLGDVVDEYGHIAWLKIDCEGCEYEFLDSPDIDEVVNIIGEFHHKGYEKIQAMLEATHTVELLRNEDMITGIFLARPK